MIMEELHVQITGVHDEDDFTKADIDVAVKNFAHKIAGLFKGCISCEEALELVVKRHNISGGHEKNIKYSVHAKLQTTVGLIVAEAHGFGKLITIVQDCLSKIEKELKKKHAKMVEK